VGCERGAGEREPVANGSPVGGGDDHGH
jgi:hypothetical protein